MFRKIQSRLELKILLLIILVLITGFGTYVVITIQAESKALMAKHHEQLWLFSETIGAGIRNVMLTGKAPLASEFVNDARQSLSFGQLTVYDRFGREVFLREGEGIVYHVTDPQLLETLSSHKPQSTMMGGGKQQVWTRYEPLWNRPECWRCHDPKDSLRGAIQLALHPRSIETSDTRRATQQMAGIMGNAIATAFRTIMVGGNGPQMDTLTANARDIPGVAMVQVYSKDGFLSFGPESYEIPDTKIVDLLKPKTTDQTFENLGNKIRLYIPLTNQDRCQVCHGSKFPMRGVMVIDFVADTLRKYLNDPARMFTTALQAAIFEGFRSIMLVGRAGSVRYYMDELRQLPIVHTLRAFDRVANERFLNPPPRSRAELKSVVDSKQATELFEWVNGEEFMVRLSPLPNEVRCYSCHGRNHEVRGVVEVSASMHQINADIAANKRWSAVVGIITISLVYGALRLFMRSVVVKPVQIIEGVAHQIGKGDFSVQADARSRDEIGNLARSINDMIQGLRERFHLQKFVSQQTVEAVRNADLTGVKLGGERRVATVFFSDIRGFTSYSEKVEPERVIKMLNKCLSRQSAVVRKYGGDIDKYVGDELVAVFMGERMVQNAVRAAIEIQRDMETGAGADEDHTISIGIGINTGEMVMGAMGSDERMDYTVIGDNVNLGARLCSVAKPGQILLSDASAKYIADDTDLKLRELEPMTVKGKQAPLKVYEVEWK